MATNDVPTTEAAMRVCFQNRPETYPISGFVVSCGESLTSEKYAMNSQFLSNHDQCVKWKRAQEGVSTTEAAFEQLTDSLDPALIDEWTNQERVAMEKRGDHLNIFTVSLDKHESILQSHNMLTDGSQCLRWWKYV